MPRSIVFELCADSLQSCLTAGRAGAHRIELCTALEVGGVTPDEALIASACRDSGLPVHVLVRPSARTFQFSADVFSSMRDTIPVVRSLGAAGIVVGVLRADGTVDVEHTRELVEWAAPLPLTFHRAFDHTPDLEHALEDVIACGCSRVLTSGGAANASAGAARLGQLVAQSAGRIDVAVAGELRPGNAADVGRTSGATHFHASLKRSPDEAVDQGELHQRIQDIVRVLSST